MPPQTYIPRVNGQLALSRAFGDFQLKMSKKVEQHEQAVITDPDVDIFDRNDISHIGKLGFDIDNFGLKILTIVKV